MLIKRKACIAFSDIFDDVTFFKVGNYSPFISDHCPIFYDTSIVHCQKEKCNVQLEDSLKAFCLNNQDKKKLTEILKSNEVVSKLAALNEIDSPNPQNLASNITNTLLDACSKAGIKPKKQPTESEGQEPW